MPIVKKAATTATKPETPKPTEAAPAASKPRIRRAAPAAPPAEAPAETPAATKAAPKIVPAKTTTAGIMTAAQRAALAAKQETAPDPAAAVAPADDDMSWVKTGAEAEALAAEIAARKEQEREERKARGYWPQRFGLIPPSMKYPNRYQADVIVLDAQPGPSYWEHVLRNPKNGRYDVIEPCPHEYDNCPLCGPENTSKFVMLLTVLNINGYTIQTGDRAGQHVPITKELLVPMAGDHAFFHKLVKDHGSLRGIQLTMTRTDKFQPNIGVPAFVGRFTDEEIEAYIKSQGMWKPKVTREGEELEGEDWLMHAFTYKDFLHRPSGADLRQRYANGVPAPVGAIGGGTGTDPQWGNSRYAPGTAGIPGGTPVDELSDDIPF